MNMIDYLDLSLDEVIDVLAKHEVSGEYASRNKMVCSKNGMESMFFLRLKMFGLTSHNVEEYKVKGQYVIYNRWIITPKNKWRSISKNKWYSSKNLCTFLDKVLPDVIGEDAYNERLRYYENNLKDTLCKYKVKVDYHTSLIFSSP